MPDDAVPEAEPPRRGPIRKRRLHEEVAARVQELIADLRLRPGDRLPAERELMAEFGVGRSAVREAMLALERAGAVAVSSGERTRVARPSARALVGQLAGPARLLLAEPGGAETFRDARVLVEAGLARLAARRATADDLAMLADLRASALAVAADPAALARADAALRYGIVAVARNGLLADLLAAASSWLDPGPGAGDPEAILAGHAEILAAIAAGDAEPAGAAMERHLGAGPP